MVPFFLIFATAAGLSRSGAEMDMNEKGLAAPVGDNEVSFIFLGY
jgi:hypothetical protein